MNRPFNLYVRIVTAVAAFAFLFAAARPLFASPAPEIERLVKLAGNADDEPTRLKYLRQLRQRPDLDSTFTKELNLMIRGAEMWLGHPWLPFFYLRDAKEPVNYLRFEVREDSPLYPLLCFYRARQLLWTAVADGTIWKNEERRKKNLDAVFDNLRRAERAFPKNRLIQMYLGRPMPPEKQYPAVKGAPAWAVYQREGLERLTDIIEWWIDHRQKPSGFYGGGDNDDIEMWRFWVPAMIAFESPKITGAQERLSRGIFKRPYMAGGYQTMMTDVEHSAEPIGDTLTPMMHLDPDNPEWRERTLRLVELMETLWTGRNERGFLQFKSTYFTVNKVDDSPQRACDTVYHPRAVQPALLLWQRTRDPRLTRLFCDWMDTWADAAARAERGKPAGILPTAIHWPDGAVGGLGKDWWNPENHGEPTLYQWPSASAMMVSTLLLAWHITGNEKYMAPLRSMAEIRLKYAGRSKKEKPVPGSEAWCAEQLDFLSWPLAKYTLLTGSKEFETFFERVENPYALFRLRGNRRALEAALRKNAEALSVNWPGFTSEVRYTDRVIALPRFFNLREAFPKGPGKADHPQPELLYATATGDPGGDLGYFPLNAVRWLTPPREIAALVTEANTTHFAAELFHFGEKPRRMAAEFYLLKPGTYTMTLSLVKPAKSLKSETIEVGSTRHRVAFELPPRQLCLLRIQPQ
ncbi:MAG: hypothetical protein N3D11_07845 [Candidatus Sumerlaeia bacterium]|nr:hypothetical protein [Candidatus Sumerlaeia bacterium]